MGPTSCAARTQRQARVSTLAQTNNQEIKRWPRAQCHHPTPNQSFLSNPAGSTPYLLPPLTHSGAPSIPRFRGMGGTNKFRHVAACSLVVTLFYRCHFRTECAPCTRPYSCLLVVILSAAKDLRCLCLYSCPCPCLSLVIPVGNLLFLCFCLLPVVLSFSLNLSHPKDQLRAQHEPGGEGFNPRTSPKQANQRRRNEFPSGVYITQLIRAHLHE